MSTTENNLIPQGYFFVEVWTKLRVRTFYIFCYTCDMKDDREIVLETPYWKVILMEQQLYIGRCIVLLKRPCGELSGLDKNEAIDFFEIVKKLENLFKKTFKATMFNWSCSMNDAYKTKPYDSQVHWHFRPRYENPVEINGQVFKDPNFAHHYLRGDFEIKVSKEIQEIINKKLQENL